MKPSLNELVFNLSTNSIFSEKNSLNLEFLQQIINSLEECILVLDINKNVLLTNLAFQNNLKLANKTLSSSYKCTDIFDTNTFSCDTNKNQCPFEEISRTHKSIKTIHHYTDGKDISRYIELSMTPLYDKNTNIYGFVESRRDISDHIRINQTLKENEIKLYELAHHDILTGIPNRRLFLTQLENAITLAQAKNEKLALLFIDLDNFKQINDTLGHPIGDEVLKITAKRLLRVIRENDIACRLGGDEFVILANSIKTPENAGLLAQKIIDKQSRKFKIGQHELYMNSSIGISIYPENGTTAESLLQRADIAMYQSKQLGRNTYNFYSQELTDNSLNRILLEKELNQALSKNQLVIYYQPQVNLESGKLSGMEAMIRWQHPTKGLLSPDKFIYIAEQSSLIEDIGQWILETVCSQIVTWEQAGEKPGRVAINLAGRQLLNNNLVKNIITILEQSQCSTHSLEFKITEGYIPHLTHQSIETLKTLRDMGIELSIDDFGKGYASLAFLKRLPITRLKIDRSFIQNNGNKSPDEDIARAIIALGESLNLKVMAEGVEHENQQSLLARVGCKEAQGYLFGHPMNSHDMSMFLGKK